MKLKRSLLILALLLSLLPMKQYAQQPKLIKVSEFSVSNIRNMEERVFMVHTILERGYYCFKNPNLPNTIDVYVSSDASDELSDFDFYYDHLLYDQLNEFSYYDKDTRGELYVEWRQGIGEEVYKVLYEDFTKGTRSDNATCETAFPFCTDVGLYDFPAGVDSGSPCGPETSSSCSEPYKCSGTPGQSSSCLYTAPNPAFYYLRIDEPGNLNIYMHSTPQVDIDFDCWGPFDDINTACDLLACSNIVDCSYSTAATEYCHINNAQTGEFYILLITNYSNDPCNISFENVGTGTTDCSIMPPLVNGGGPYCVGDTIELTAQNQAGATFSWEGPNNFNSIEQNPVIPNCTMEMAGVYTCTITVGDESSSAETEYVEINATPTADFTFVSACEGSPVVFSSTSTTNPVGQDITSIEWDFGDGQTGSGANVNHTYAVAGDYEVTLNVGTHNNICTDQKTQTVTVYAIPSITASASPSSVMYGSSSTITVTVETPGNFSYHWEPANMVLDPNSQTTQTVGLEETQVFTVTVTNLQGGCTNTAQVTVMMAGSSLTAQATVDDNEICQNGSTTLHALPAGGTGNYTYSWTPANSLSAPNSQNPVASPPVGNTTYTCIVSDGLTQQQVSVSVTVHPIYEYTMPDQDNCDSYYWDPQGHEIVYTDHEALDYTQSGTYHRTYRDIHGCDSLVTMNVHIDYTPTPSDIYPTDSANTAPHWVVTATEFQINSYEFTFWDNTGLPRWDSIRWAFEDPTVNWVLEPDTTTQPVGRRCKMYVLNHIDDTIWLRATVYNNCAPQGVYSRYWFVCSFYDIDEFGPSTGSIDFNVVPNPNNGEMQLDLASLRGLVDIKVYDMRGNLIDKFQTHNDNNAGPITYTMKRRTQGIYFFVVTSKDGMRTKKVVIQP